MVRLAVAALAATLAASAAWALPLPRSADITALPLIRVTGDITAPEAVVRSLYGHYANTLYPGDLPTLYFSPDLLDLYNRVEEGAGDDMEMGIEADVFINAQDYDEVTILDTAAHDLGGGRSLVTVRFTNFGEGKTFVYTMVETGEGWKVDDIDWGGGAITLRDLLGNLLKQQAG